MRHDDAKVWRGFGVAITFHPDLLTQNWAIKARQGRSLKAGRTIKNGYIN